MKNYILLLIILLPLSLSTQSLNQNPYLNYFLNANTHDVSMASILPRSYNGLVKNDLLYNMPSHWILSYSLNHNLVSGRYSDADMAFGRLILNIGGGSMNSGRLTFYSSHIGETDLSLSTKFRINRKIKTAFLANYHNLKSNRDKNDDTFKDINNKEKLLFINSWSFNKRNYISNINAYYFHNNELGGQIDFDKEQHYLGNEFYGLGTNIRHGGISFQNDFFFFDDETNNKKSKFYFDVDARITQFDYFYGTRLYQGDERLLNAFVGQKIYKVMSEWEWGLHYKNLDMKESLTNIVIPDQSYQQGSAYLRYFNRITYKMNLEGDLRFNYFDDKTWAFTPFVEWTYKPYRDLAFNLFGGNGIKDVFAFNQYRDILYNNKSLNIDEKLNRESAWYYGTSLKWSPNYTIDVDYDNFTIGNFYVQFYYHHHFYDNLILANYDEENLSYSLVNMDDGTIRKKSFQLNYGFSPYRNLFFRFFHRFERFNINENERMYYPRNTFMLASSYNFRDYFEISSQFHILGEMPTYKGYSTPQKRWDLSIEFPISRYIYADIDPFRNLKCLIGFENITNRRENNIILSPHNPFNENMEGANMVGSPIGTKFYFGVQMEM